MGRHKYFEVKDGRAEPTRDYCPKCGEGIFLAEHKDRHSCGKCGYTEFKKSKG
ncbi:MAG: 30S ribosomal protein S27ae [Thermoplasmata archaeon]|nr:MAG: 30S ribosomal protein S27ae [Thermoplasmata archaeon]